MVWLLHSSIIWYGMDYMPVATGMKWIFNICCNWEWISILYQHIFLAAMSSSRSDDVTKFVCPSVFPESFCLDWSIQSILSKMFWGSYKGVSGMSIWSFNGVSRKFKGCLKFEESFQDISRKFWGCLQKISREFQWSFKGVSRKFQCCFRDVSTLPSHLCENIRCTILWIFNNLIVKQIEL